MSFAAELAETLGFLPAWLAVMMLAMSPIGEVRLAIPIAILAYGMGWAEAFTWALAGNLIVVPMATWFYPAFESWMRKSNRLSGFLDRIYLKTQRKNEHRVRRLREMVVFGFIATPIPGTGAWSGVLVAHVFGIPLRASWRYYYAGIVVACMVTVGLVEAGLWGFNRL